MLTCVRACLGLLSLLCLAADLAEGGTITGVVTARGKEGAEQDVAEGKYQSRKFKFVERVDYNSMRGFVVYIEQASVTNAAPPAEPVEIVTQRITQKGAVFTPHVLPVLVGTTVTWPNHDDIYHNVFSVSEPKPFDLGLYKDPEVKQVTFDRPGRVDVFCSIHAAMHCTVLVLTNPFFASTDRRGKYAIPNVPPGKYRLKAWHERMPSQVQEVTVPESGEVRVDFTLGINNLPKY